MNKTWKTNILNRIEVFNKIWKSLTDINSPVIVEGKRDTKALRNLGFGGIIIELNDGNSVLSTVENIAYKFGRRSKFVVLTDWDRTGGTLAKQLKEYGESCDLIPNLRIRQRLSVLSSKEITCIEELPTFVNALKSEI
jgi:5S rRNA maturation endonuclease (ribonuclease M5)